MIVVVAGEQGCSEGTVVFDECSTLQCFQIQTRGNHIECRLLAADSQTTQKIRTSDSRWNSRNEMKIFDEGIGKGVKKVVPEKYFVDGVASDVGQEPRSGF